MGVKINKISQWGSTFSAIFYSFLMQFEMYSKKNVEKETKRERVTKTKRERERESDKDRERERKRERQRHRYREREIKNVTYS